MDSSGLIFVALAIAWAVYLIPKALSYHDDAQRARSVDRFSRRMRVLARREPSGRSARLVVTPAGSAPDTPAPPVEPSTPAAADAEPTAAAVRVRRAAHQRATRRRRRVLALILLSGAAVCTLAGLRYFTWWYAAIPGGVLLTWLVACRIMVKGERRSLARARTERKAPPPAVVLPSDTGEVADELVYPDEIAVARNDQGFDEVDPSAVTSVLADPPPAAGLWDPVPLTLPTYVTKPPAARRTVSTIDLDTTGVWSSGRSAADSALARQADAARSEGGDAASRRVVG